MQETLQKQTHKTKQKNAWKYILSVIIIIVYSLQASDGSRKPSDPTDLF